MATPYGPDPASPGIKFIDFWTPVIEAGLPRYDDNRANAEAELAEYCAGDPDPETGMHWVWVQAGADWLARDVPPEWIADMLETFSRYPSCDFILNTVDPMFWQQRMRPVAKLDSPGGRIAADWLDHRPPLGVRVISTNERQLFAAAIPLAPRRKAPSVPA